MLNPKNAERYVRERTARWGMADIGEEKAIKKITATIAEKTGRKVGSFRLDELVHKKRPPELFEWAKGCPDYAAYMDDGAVMIEIKLKAAEFRKTAAGGRTKFGATIENYGCPSYYLDIYPVWNNMNAFCSKMRLPTGKFIVAFFNADALSCRIISLAKINRVIKEGWRRFDRKIPICRYGEGYGKETYLIPRDAAPPLESISGELLDDLFRENPDANDIILKLNPIDSKTAGE